MGNYRDVSSFDAADFAHQAIRLGVEVRDPHHAEHSPRLAS
jgi:hypothetical protein